MTEGRFTQARIRVDRYGARELAEALDKHLGDLLDAREAVYDVEEARRKLDTLIAHTRRVIEEVERTSAEQGWPDGELQQQHA